MFIQCTAHLAILGLFKLNQDYIVKNLCENRSKPQKKCCGKCYLKKQLKNATDNENGSSKTPTVKIEKSEVVCLLPKVLTLTPAIVFKSPSVYNPVSKAFIVMPFSSSVFHPPSISC